MGTVTTRTRFQHSEHAARAVESPRPTWRGRMHRVAAVVWPPVGLWLVLAAEPGVSRSAAVLFAIGTGVMFLASASYHRRQWTDPGQAELMLRVDHTGIYFAIAGAASAFGLLGLPDPVRTVVVVAVLVAVVIGLVVEWLPFANPRGLNNAIFLTIGWGSVIVLPLFWQQSGFLPAALLIVGGIFYSVGVAVVGFQRPALRPETFGYHELWHLLVILAVVTHTAAIHHLAT